MLYMDNQKNKLLTMSSLELEQGTSPSAGSGLGINPSTETLAFEEKDYSDSNRTQSLLRSPPGVRITAKLKPDQLGCSVGGKMLTLPAGSSQNVFQHWANH